MRPNGSPTLPILPSARSQPSLASFWSFLDRIFARRRASVPTADFIASMDGVLYRVGPATPPEQEPEPTVLPTVAIAALSPSRSLFEAATLAAACLTSPMSLAAPSTPGRSELSEFFRAFSPLSSPFRSPIATGAAAPAPASTIIGVMDASPLALTSPPVLRRSTNSPAIRDLTLPAPFPDIAPSQVDDDETASTDSMPPLIDDEDDLFSSIPFFQLPTVATAGHSPWPEAVRRNRAAFETVDPVSMYYDEESSPEPDNSNDEDYVPPPAHKRSRRDLPPQ